MLNASSLLVDNLVGYMNTDEFPTLQTCLDFLAISGSAYSKFHVLVVGIQSLY